MRVYACMRVDACMRVYVCTESSVDAGGKFLCGEPQAGADLNVMCRSSVGVPNVSASISSVAVAKTIPALAMDAHCASASQGAWVVAGRGGKTSVLGAWREDTRVRGVAGHESKGLGEGTPGA